MNICPCGSGKAYAECCGPFISGAENPASAEQLMRSRYTAYVREDVDYIVDTHIPRRREDLDVEATRIWAKEAEWLGLEIIRCENGGTGDETGLVEFKATYRQDGEEIVHHEVSEFRREGGKWFFEEGFPARDTYVRDAPKVGRNDPCPCGSGKKYKKCCGA
jgi:SEC-C motif-containing protein